MVLKSHLVIRIHMSSLMYCNLCIIFILSFFPSSIIAQDKTEIISLQKKLEAVNNPEDSIYILNSLSWEYQIIHLDSAILFARQALHIAERNNIREGIANASTMLGMAYEYKGDYKSSLENHQRALQLKKDLRDNRGVSISLEYLGRVHDVTGNYPKALEFYQQALSICEKQNDQEGIATIKNNIGIIHQNTKNYTLARKYFKEALQTNKKLENELLDSKIIINTGTLYADLDDYEKAMEYFHKALKIRKNKRDLVGLSICYNNIGNAYIDLMQYDKAIKNILLALDIDRQIGDNEGIILNLISIGEVYSKAGNNMKALETVNEGYQLARKTGYNNGIRKATEIMSKVYFNIQDYQNAYRYLEENRLITDSIYNKEKSNQIALLELSYQSSKKEQQIALQQLEIDRKEADLNKELVKRRALIISLALSIILIIVIVLSLRTKQKDNRLLRQQKEEIESQRDKLSQQHDDITSSINYAKRIQDVLLPPMETVKSIFPECFIINMPRDIVSGDFYWINKIGDNIIFSVVDCTGHGIPGAFMSVLGVSLFNEVIIKKRIMQSDMILNELRIETKKALHQQGKVDEMHEGMDLALCILNLKTNILQFSGAYNYLYLLRDKKIFQYKGDTMPIGKHIKERTSFSKQEIPIQKNDIVYLFTDGIIDQLSGKYLTKYSSATFRQKIIEISHEPIDTQKKRIETEFNIWKGETPQTDDVLVLGIKL